MTRDKAIYDLLRFYQEAGVDTALGELAIDRLADAPPPTVEQPVEQRAQISVHTRSLGAGGTQPPSTDNAGLRPPSVPAPSPAPTPEAAVVAAREAARTAASLEDLRTILARFEGCTLRNTAKQLVFADGNPASRLMFVGEAPGRDEDIEGLPFVGRSGKLLERMLTAIGLDRSSVYIANIVPWRPPGNRTPTPQESAICLPFTLRQIELANPDVLVCLGGPSAQTLLQIKDGIMKSRGRWHKFHTGTRDIRAMPTLHPAYLLRSPIAKRLAWRDFMAIRKALAIQS